MGATWNVVAVTASMLLLVGCGGGNEGDDCTDTACNDGLICDPQTNTCRPGGTDAAPGTDATPGTDAAPGTDASGGTDAAPGTDGGTDSSITTDGGGTCVIMGGSCSDINAVCCGGLTCCAGTPVPPGAEYCGPMNMCPMCASPDTPIATPSGDRPIADLKVGDTVFSMHAGRLVAVPVARVNRTPVSLHGVVRLVLANGHTLEVSGGHPTADGRPFAALAPGDDLGGVQIVEVAMIPYEHPFTYDILPDSDTGTYVAGGALIGTTLTR